MDFTREDYLHQNKSVHLKIDTSFTLLIPLCTFSSIIVASLCWQTSGLWIWIINISEVNNSGWFYHPPTADQCLSLQRLLEQFKAVQRTDFTGSGPVMPLILPTLLQGWEYLVETEQQAGRDSKIWNTAEHRAWCFVQLPGLLQQINLGGCNPLGFLWVSESSLDTKFNKTKQGNRNWRGNQSIREMLSTKA